MEKKDKRLHIKVYPHFYARIEKAMEFLNVNKTDFITRAIAEYLEKIEKQMDEPCD